MSDNKEPLRISFRHAVADYQMLQADLRDFDSKPYGFNKEFKKRTEDMIKKLRKAGKALYGQSFDPHKYLEGRQYDEVN